MTGQLWKVLASEPIPEPFPHIVVEDVFDQHQYERMLRNLPGAKPGFKKTDIPAAGRFWGVIANWFNDEFTNAMSEKFGVSGITRTSVRTVVDAPGFRLGPHTDDPKKVLSLIFYLTEKVQDVGTVLYTHEDPGFRSDGTQHFPLDGFVKAKKVPFLPNSMMGFARTDRSFHGVEKISGYRYTLLYNAYRD